MVQYPNEELDGSFAALSDPIRRSILERLGRGSATISELAQPYEISLTGLKKHVAVLEAAGLVRTEKVGRSRHCHLVPAGIETAQVWIESYRRMVEERLDRFEELLGDGSDGSPPVEAGNSKEGDER
jgi:DNA-binding transcriptional ArsR family regulator